MQNSDNCVPIFLVTLTVQHCVPEVDVTCDCRDNRKLVLVLHELARLFRNSSGRACSLMLVEMNKHSFAVIFGLSNHRFEPVKLVKPLLFVAADVVCVIGFDLLYVNHLLYVSFACLYCSIVSSPGSFEVSRYLTPQRTVIPATLPLFAYSFP